MVEVAPPTPDPVVRVLFVDDDEDDFFLTRDLLQDVPGGRYQIDWEADSVAALEAICRGKYDAYLIDYRLGVRTGLDLIRDASERNRSAPLILLTGQGEREIDVAAMRAGAADYLEKRKLDSLILDRSLRYAIQKKQSEEQLEKRVGERTLELAQANQALQREIRERLRAEEALREVNRRKDEFLATLAHELRNPLAPIRNSLEIMRLGAHDPKAIDRGRTMMERQVAHMVRLIDDLLDISRITRGKIELRKERIELSNLVNLAIEGSRPQIDAARQELKISLPETTVWLEADPTRISQVLINLLTNAAKYSEPGGKIFLTASTESAWLILKVRDTGIGIAPEILPHIFEMFAQADRSRQRSQGGLGIGLSLVRGLVSMHGGTVQAHSAGLGQGSEFVVRIPLLLGGPESSAAG